MNYIVVVSSERNLNQMNFTKVTNWLNRIKNKEKILKNSKAMIEKKNDDLTGW